MLAGELYSPLSGDLARERARAKKLLHQLNVTEYLMTDKTAVILRELIPNAPKDLLQ